MNHLLLLLLCILSIEIIIRSNFLSNLNSIIYISRKAINILPSSKISDHWKEIVIPSYALKIMNFSIKILFTLVFIISLFLIIELVNEGFISFTISLIGILESVICASLFLYLRHLFVNE